MPDERAMAEAWNTHWSTDEAGYRTDEPRFHFEAGWRAHEAAGRAEAPDADEEALWRAIDQWCTEDPPSAVIDLHHAVEALIAYRERRYVEALEQERAQFQRETLRTSELHRMLERAGSYIREVDGPDSPLARAFAREISELLAKPINAAAPASPGGGVMVLRNVGDDLQGARDEALREAALDAWYWANSAQPGYDSPALRAQEAAMWQRLGAALYPNAAAPAEENTDAR